MPDIGNLTGEQCPGFPPVGAVIVGDLASAGGRANTSLIPPRWIVFDAIGRIGDHQVRLGPSQQAVHVGGHRAVATQQPVLAHDPQITRARHRIDGRLGNLIFVPVTLAFALVVDGRHQGVQFLFREAD